MSSIERIKEESLPVFIGLTYDEVKYHANKLGFTEDKYFYVGHNDFIRIQLTYPVIYIVGSIRLGDIQRYLVRVLPCYKSDVKPIVYRLEEWF